MAPRGQIEGHPFVFSPLHHAGLTHFLLCGLWPVLGRDGCLPAGRGQERSLSPCSFSGSALQPELALSQLQPPPPSRPLPPACLPVLPPLGDSLMTIIRVCVLRGSGEGLLPAESASQPPSPLGGQQPVAAPEAEDLGGAGQEPLSPPPLFPFPPQACSELCSNYKWFDNFRPTPVIKNKEEDRQHCLLTTPLIGGVNFNGVPWRRGFQKGGGSC